MSILKNAQTDTHIVRQFLLSNILLNAADEKMARYFVLELDGSRKERKISF